MGHKPLTTSGVDMTRRYITQKFQVLSADSTTDPTSTETGVKNLDNVRYEITCEAGVIGTLVVEGSSDEDNTTIKTFNPLDFGTPITINGSLSTFDEIVIRQNPYKFLRLTFTNNAGTGNISAFISGNSAGA